MKIERISENQIKCTLTRSDLASRQLKLSELAYGTEKARGLFQDMMDQANLEFGFDASDIPLMIEAIPVSMDCIILMITKVENPEEVDTRFSTIASLKDLFAGNVQEEDDFMPAEDSENPFGQFSELLKQIAQKNTSSGEYLFSFGSLETVIDLAHQASKPASVRSFLYKSPEDGRFYLQLIPSDGDAEGFSRLCRAALEFGISEPCSQARSAYIKEHFELLLKEDALRHLSYV